MQIHRCKINQIKRRVIPWKKQCGHCEAAVKKALEALPQVDEAVVSHEKGTAVVKLNAEIADETLKKTVEDKDYQVVSVK